MPQVAEASHFNDIFCCDILRLQQQHHWLIPSQQRYVFWLSFISCLWEIERKITWVQSQVVSLPNLAPGQHQVSRQTTKEPEAEQFRPQSVKDFDPREVAEALQANPDIAQVWKTDYVIGLVVKFIILGVGKTDWKWPKPGRGKTWTLKPDPKSHSSLATQRPLASLPSWPTRTKSFPQTLPSQHHHPVSQEQVVCIIEAHPLHQGVCSLVTLNGHPCDPGEPFLTPVHLEILEYQHKSFLFRSCLQSLDWQLRVAWYLDWVWLQSRRY